MEEQNADCDRGCFEPLTPEEVAALTRCKTCGGIYPLECPPHVTAPAAGGPNG